MKKSLILISYLILFFSTVDAQYKWIERKYNKPVHQISDLELNDELKISTTRVYIYSSIFLSGMVSFTVGAATFDMEGGSSAPFFLLLYGVISPLVSAPFIIVNATRIGKINRYRTYGRMVSQLSVHSVFLKPTIHNKTIPCLSLTYRF